MRLLHRSGKRAKGGRRIVFTGEIDGFGGEELFDDGQPLFKAGDAYTSLVKGNAELLVLVRLVARA